MTASEFCRLERTVDAISIKLDLLAQFVSPNITVEQITEYRATLEQAFEQRDKVDLLTLPPALVELPEITKVLLDAIAPLDNNN